jgi:hypothetical protein
MADGNFMTSQKLLGNCVHEMEWKFYYWLKLEEWL